jgi:hypothetical protein
MTAQLWLHRLTTLLPIIVLIVLTGVLLAATISLLARLVYWRRLTERKLVFLELTPPAFTVRTPSATQQLISVIHGLRSSRSLKDKLLRRNIVLSLEMVSARESGVRYIVPVEQRLAANMQQAITAYLPDVKVAEVTDFLPDVASSARIIELKQTGHYAFPLVSQDSLVEHDPVAYLTGAMTKLATGEHIAFQIVLTPVKLNEASVLAHKILGNEDLLGHVSRRKLPIWQNLTRFINSLLFGVLEAVTMVWHTPQPHGSGSAQRDAHDRAQVAKRVKPARTLSVFEQQLVESMHEKVSQPLFRVSIRVLVAMDTEQAERERLGAIKSSLASYSVPSYQALQPRLTLPFVAKLRHYAFIHRLPALFPRHACVLSASEVASLYHFPIGETTRTDNLVTSLSRTLPAPLSLKQNTGFDLLLGRNYHHGTETDIGLTEPERQRHVYIIGGTGNGKTTMLQYAIYQDMHSGKGLAVIDPHGDLAATLLQYVPKDRLKDVVYFNPDDLDHPIGLNVLELPPGLSGNELLREKDIVTEAVVSVFRKIFSDEDTGGHRIEYVLRNAIHTALTVEGATLFTVLKLLQNAAYRKKIINKLEDEDLKDFWKSELGQAGNMQRVKMSAGITAKIGRFKSNAAARLIMSQEKSTIDFEDIINSGKILICNFSKGLLGEDVSELFGITILAKLQLASLRRARLSQEERRPFYLYVDEFQNFATASFVQMLSEARKYKLFMTMAEQSTSQQKDQQMVNVILANVGTVITFRSGNPADERLMLPLFSPYIEEGEIANLSAFNFYAKLSAMKAQEPLSGQTVLVRDKGSRDIAEQVIEQSRQNYAVALSEKPGDIPATTATDEEGTDNLELSDALPDEA